MNGCPCLARPEDAEELLRVMESGKPAGAVSLLITRRPDPYASYMAEPGEARVYAARANGRITCTCAMLTRDLYIGGEKKKAAYLCGLKKDEGARTAGFGPSLFRDFAASGADLWFLSIVKGNDQAQKLLKKGKRLLSLEALCAYRTFLVKPKKMKARPSLPFRRATASDAPALLEFIRREGSKKELFPVPDKLFSFPGLSCGDFRILFKDGRIAAAAAFWDRSAQKQYIPLKYGLPLRALGALSRFAGRSALPEAGRVLNYPFLSFFLAENDDRETASLFLDALSDDARGRYERFIIGVPEGHCAFEKLKKMTKISFSTELYAVSFPFAGVESAPVTREVFPECALL